MSVVQKQHAVASHRPVQHHGGHNASPQDDPPVDLRTNQTPASIEVVSNLAEDTVIGGVMDIATGANKVAMFANPFVDGAEEMLYIDENKKVYWARHMNPSKDEAQPAVLNGWSIEEVKPESTLVSTIEVVVAVHPQGSVWAFFLVQDSLGGYSLAPRQLVQDASVLGGLRWAGTGLLLVNKNRLQGLSVQYCKDRPATPFVFVTNPSEPRLYWFTSSFPTGAANIPWRLSGELKYDDADRNAPVMAAVDGPERPFSQGVAVPAVRIWSLDKTYLFETLYVPTQGLPYYRTQVGAFGGYDKLLGIWNSSDGGGVVVQPKPLPGTNQQLEIVSPQMGWSAITLDRPLDDVVVWQDADNLLHLYGRAADASLNVVHQLGWTEDPNMPRGWTKPVWDTHEDKTLKTVATTRALVGNVATFAVDPYPDELPSQHVMHQGVQPGESCAIYTQSIRTNFWYTEQVRLIPETLPKPYTVPRYQTALTVKDGYGSPMPGVRVSLTADVPVDLEVAGRFYRTGSITPVTLTTDLRGRITLRVVASGLSAPQMYATTPGLSQAVTVQMAADVHKFLAGNGTLPNHSGGFDAATVQNAKKPDGSTPLFPNIKKTGAAGDWPPSAADVVKWCRGAFSMDSDATLPTEMLAGLGAGEQVLAFTLQTHDPSRPGFQVYSRAEHLTAREQALIAKGGFIADWDDWVGDVWQGIRRGVTAVGEVFVDVANRAIELVITLADGVIQRLKAAWDDIVSAAHAIEGAFVALGAKLAEAIEWLRWAFNFHDVWMTKKALEGGVMQLTTLPTKLLEWLRKEGHKWIGNKDTEITQAFAQYRAMFARQGLGAFDSPTLGKDGKTTPEAMSMKTHMQSGHASWAQDHFLTASVDEARRGVKREPTDVPALDKLLTEIAGNDAWTRVQPIYDRLSAGFTGIFNWEDPQAAVTTTIVAFLDLFEEIAHLALGLADSALNLIIDFVEAILASVVNMLNEPLTGVPLLQTIYEFIQDCVGVAPEQYEELTIGRAATLFAAYPITIVYKAVFGETPFPDGKFPDLSKLNSSRSRLGHAHVGGPILPPSWTSQKVIQGYCGIFMAFDAFFDVIENAMVMPKEEINIQLPSWWYKIWAGNHMLAYGLGDWPAVWGIELPYESGNDNSAQNVLPCVMWAFSIVANGIDVGVAWKYGYFVNRFELEDTKDPKKYYSAMLFFLLGLGRTIMSGVRYEIADDKGYDYAIQNCAINVTSFFSATTGWVRYIYGLSFTKPAPPPPWATTMLVLKSLLDFVCDMYAGAGTVWQVAHEDNDRPMFDAPTLPLASGTVGQSYEGIPYSNAHGGFQPYDWFVRPVNYTPPLGKADGLPEGFSFDDSGTIKGDPKVPGNYQFYLVMQDDYGPSFFYESDGMLTLEIRPVPNEKK